MKEKTDFKTEILEEFQLLPFTPFNANARKLQSIAIVLCGNLKKKKSLFLGKKLERQRSRCFGLNAPVRGPPALQRAAVLGRMAGEDLQGQVLVELPLRPVQTLQGLQLDEGLRAGAERPADCGAEGQQGVDLHHGDDVLVLSQIKSFI